MDIELLGELALTGALVGAMYGLVALGIVLIYKTSGTANFAQGAISLFDLNLKATVAKQKRTRVVEEYSHVLGIWIEK